jgi:hypothetical protein
MVTLETEIMVNLHVNRSMDATALHCFQGKEEISYEFPRKLLDGGLG